MRLREAEAILAERPLTDEVREEVRRAVMEKVRPIDDVRTTAEYRRDVTGTLTLRAVDAVLAHIGGAA